MSLLRAAARTMLASFYIINGVKAIRDPEPLTAAAEPLAKTFVPLAQKTLPEQVAAYLPEDTPALIRLNGALQVAGGLSLATGIGRRAGAGLLAVTMIPHVLASNPLKVPPAERSATQSLLLRNIALLGGVVLASQDTEGRPNLAYRANTQKELLGRDAEHAKASLTREAERTKATITREAKRAAKKAKKAGQKARKSIEDALS